MIGYLLKACEVCERGASISKLRQVGFRDSRLHAFNGIYQYQAPSGLPPEEEFAVSEERLVSALRSCAEGTIASVTKDFLRLKNGPLTVRVRKVQTPVDYDRITMPKSAANQRCVDFGLLAALQAVRPFISDDASRPWGMSVLLKNGYAWATNNLALVRSPLKIPALLEGVKLPAPAVHFLCDFPELGHYHIDEQARIVITLDKALVRFPQSRPEWPDVDRFFAKMAKNLAEVPEELRTATEVVRKFTDHFVSLSAEKVESKNEALESEYEIEFKKGIGRFNAKLLSLILSVTTHADFSFYPEPIFFRGERIEGTAAGIVPENPTPQGGKP